MGLLVRLFIEDTKKQLSVLIQDCKDDSSPEKTILNVTLPLPTKSDSAGVSDIDECRDYDLAEEARNDVKPDTSNMETAVEEDTDECALDDYISVCDSVDDDVKPRLCVIEEVTGENVASTPSPQDQVADEANVQDRNEENLTIVDVLHCEGEATTRTNEDDTSDRQNEEPDVTDDSDLQEITFVDSEVNGENTEENVGTNPLETTTSDTIANRVTNVNISRDRCLRKTMEKNDSPKNVDSEISGEEPELQISLDDELLEMGQLNISSDSAEHRSEKDKNSQHKTDNRIEDQRSTNIAYPNGKIVDLTEERENREINPCQSTSSEPDDYMFRNRRNAATNSDDEPEEITIEDNEEENEEDFDEEFEEIDFTGSDDDEEDMEYMRFRRNNQNYWPDRNEIPSVPAYDVDSESDNENEPCRRDSDVQVVDLTEEKPRGNGRNQYVCIDLTSERAAYRSNDERYIPMMVPVRRSNNDVIRDVSNFYVKNKSLIEETQGALVNFEPKSPEPRDNVRKFWSKQVHDRCIESAPWNGAGCSESRPKIPKLTNNAMSRISSNYELPSQSNECTSNHYMNPHVLQSNIPVLNTNWSGNFRQFNRRLRFPPHMRPRSRFNRGHRRMRRFRPVVYGPHPSQPNPFEPEVRLKTTTQRGRMWMH